MSGDEDDLDAGALFDAYVQQEHSDTGGEEEARQGLPAQGIRTRVNPVEGQGQQVLPRRLQKVPLIKEGKGGGHQQVRDEKRKEDLSV